MATIVEVGREQQQGSIRQRYSHYFVLIYCLLSAIIALNLRTSIVDATVAYSDVQAGVRAAYPQTWAIDTEGDYVFRVRDLARIGYKTTIQVDVRPVSFNTTTRNVLDALSLDRAQTLTAYRILDIDESFTLPDGRTATAMIYTFVDVPSAPILQTVPAVIEGLDIIVIQQGQAVIVSYLADAAAFEDERPIFDRFLLALEF
jgi:hypothetical protein